MSWRVLLTKLLRPTGYQLVRVGTVDRLNRTIAELRHDDLPRLRAEVTVPDAADSPGRATADSTGAALPLADEKIARLLAELDRLPSDWHREGPVSTAVLRAIVRHVGNRPIAYSMETGTGKTTILLSHLSCAHKVFTIREGSDSLKKVLDNPLLNRANVEFVEGPSQETLPAFTFDQPLQFAMIDGPHGYPFPDLEYFHVYRHLAPGALLVLDDVHIPTIFHLFAFLRDDAMFRLVERLGTTAFFRRTDAPTFSPREDNWWLQNYNTRRFPIDLDTAG